jgi:hypothetical protein
VAANPLANPQLGTPQLVAVSPADLTGREPVLLDWLLIDAPLQGLRDNDGSWRLRVTVNGDSFLVDQNAPLWLKGWHNGSNSVLLELVDGQGASLNPPFNTMVREVLIDSSTPTPSWQRGHLGASELAQLLGEAPATPEPEPDPTTEPQSPAGQVSSPAQESLAESDPMAETGPMVETGPMAEQEPIPEPEPAVELELTEPLHTDSPQPAPATTSAPVDRLSPSTSLEGSARSQMNEDGSLLKPKAAGPLAGLR